MHPTAVSETFRQFEVGVTEKIFLIFSRKIYYAIPNLCNRPKTGMLNIPLKTASFQRFYVTFLFFTSSTKKPQPYTGYGLRFI